MSDSDEPVEPMMGAVRLSRVRTERRAQAKAVNALSDESIEFIVQLLGMMGKDPSAQTIPKSVLSKAIVDWMNSNYELIFAQQLEQTRKFIRYLSGLRLDVRRESHDLTELEGRLDALMARAKGGAGTPPILKEYDQAKKELNSLGLRLDQRALDALAIIAQTVDREAADRLLSVLTDDL